MGFLKNTKNGRVFAWTPELAKLPHMVLCSDHAAPDSVDPVDPIGPVELGHPTGPPDLPEQKKLKPAKKSKGFGGGD